MAKTGKTAIFAGLDLVKMKIESDDFEDALELFLAIHKGLGTGIRWFMMAAAGYVKFHLKKDHKDESLDFLGRYRKTLKRNLDKST